MTGNDHRTPTDVLLDARQVPDAPDVLRYRHNYGYNGYAIPIPTDVLPGDKWALCYDHPDYGYSQVHVVERSRVRQGAQAADAVELIERRESPYGEPDDGGDADA